MLFLCIHKRSFAAGKRRDPLLFSMLLIGISYPFYTCKSASGIPSEAHLIFNIVLSDQQSSPSTSPSG